MSSTTLEDYHFTALRSFIEANYAKFIDQLADEGYGDPEAMAEDILLYLDE